MDLKCRRQKSRYATVLWCHRLWATRTASNSHLVVYSRPNLQEIWNSTHVEGAKKLAGTISDMKGFYVKAAQIVAMRGTWMSTGCRFPNITVNKCITF